MLLAQRPIASALAAFDSFARRVFRIGLSSRPGPLEAGVFLSLPAGHPLAWIRTGLAALPTVEPNRRIVARYFQTSPPKTPTVSCDGSHPLQGLPAPRSVPLSCGRNFPVALSRTCSFYRFLPASVHGASAPGQNALLRAPIPAILPARWCRSEERRVGKE